MNIIAVVFVTVAVAMVTATKNSHLPSYYNADPVQRSQLARKFPRCGSTFNSATGGVYHKAFEPILPNERCVWIVGVAKAKGYTVNIQYLGSPTNQPESGQGLFLTGIGFDNNTNGVPTQVQVTPTSQGTYSVVNSNILLVSFYSSPDSPNASSGFALSWEAQYTGSVPEIAVNSSTYLMESPLFNFRYPVLPTNTYSENELSVFVFPPGRNLYHCGNEKYTYLRIIRLRENNSFICNDAFHIYHFNVTAHSWTNAGRVCNPTTTITIANDDFTLIVFQTVQTPTANEPESGFVFSYTAC